ncbi:MAG: hypothetical protein CL927_06415 [Deltaproteobacteria bacterium]|nr:hypothetical protein [Deltaproteobacteria bacterium]
MIVRWHWIPHSGGLLALVPDSILESVHQGGVALPIRVPSGAAVVRPLHLTFLSSASMAPLAGMVDPQAVLPQLPAIERIAFEPIVHVAERGPHPEKDLPLVTKPRRTGFLAVESTAQAQCHAVLCTVVAVLDRASRSYGGPSFAHPEPDRFFHLSVWNNRNGDTRGSIGNIRSSDRTP